MRLIAAAALAAGLAPAGSASALPDEPRKPWTVNEILKLRDVSDPRVSPDGRWVAFVVSEADESENAFNTDLYLAAAGPGGGGAAAPGIAEPIRLTRSPKVDRRPRWKPDGSVIAFLSARQAPGPGEGRDDKDKDDRGDQAWLIRPDGGEAWCPGTMAGGVEEAEWSPDGAALALLVREPKSADRKKREKEKDDATVVDAEIRRSQVWLMDPGTGAAVQVTRGAVHLTDLDWSPDGGRLALAGRPTPKVPDVYRSDIYTLDLAKAKQALAEEVRRKGEEAPAKDEKKPEEDPNAPAPAPLAEPRPLVTTRGPDSQPRWSPDGATIAFLTQDGSEEWYANTYVAAVPASGGAPRVLSRSFDEEASDPRWSPDGKSVLFEASTRLSQHLFRVPAGGGDAAPLTKGDALHRSLRLGRGGRAAAFVRESAGDPMEVFVADLGLDGALTSIRPLTGLNALAAGYATLVKEPFRWKGAGGMEMEGLIVKPEGTAGRKVPLLTIVHGGPAGVFSNAFSVRRGAYPVQLFAQKGFAVFMPNPRGSGAYGEAFRKSNVRDWGEKDYEDILAGVDALVASGLADPERLGVMGWSYGGFMTSRIITKTKRFKAASVGAGVTDTYSFTGVTDIPPFMRSYFGAWPWEDPAIYTARTALFSAKGVTTPTLIQHGEQDARVPISQGWELYVALKEQGVPVEFVTYPRQGHGVTEPKLIKDAMRRNLEWFSRWILGEKAP